MKRVRHATKKEAKPLYKTHPNFDLDEDAEDEAKSVAQKFAVLQGKGEGAAFASQTQMFADILKKYKKPEEPIAKYLDDFCKYKLYLAYFAVENTRDPPPIHPNDGEALVNDKQSIAAAFDGYAQFKKKLAKHKDETFAMLDANAAAFNADLRQTKELHIVLRKRELVLGNGKHMTCAHDDILHLYMAIHMVLHFESYLAHLLDDLWTTLEQEIQGMTFCFIYEMFSPHFEPFRLIFQPPPR